MNQDDHHPHDHDHGHGDHHTQRIELPNLRIPTKNSFDDSLAGVHHDVPRSPGKVIAFIHQNQDEKMNFKKWILSLVSIGNMIMSPMIVLMGFQASSYGLSKVEADKALIIMGIFIFLLSLWTLIATIKLQKRILFFILYAFTVLLIFIMIFTLGIFSFQPDIKQWVYENWGHIRSVTDRFNYEQFEKDIKNDILSLGVFSMTIIVSISICIFAIIQLLGYHVIRKRILPLLSLLIIVFSSAFIIVSVYARKNASYVNLPTWVNATAIGIGSFLMAAGAFGYYASVKRIKNLLQVYLGILIVTLGFMLYVTFGYFGLSSTFQEMVDRDWAMIYNNLLKSGYNVTKVTFMDYVMLNLKFAGLYGLMYSCFLLIAILTTISKIRMLSQHPHSRDV